MLLHKFIIMNIRLKKLKSKKTVSETKLTHQNGVLFSLQTFYQLSNNSGNLM